MSITIELPDEIETALRAEAKAKNMTVEALIIALITEWYEQKGDKT